MQSEIPKMAPSTTRSKDRQESDSVVTGFFSMLKGMFRNVGLTSPADDGKPGSEPRSVKKATGQAGKRGAQARAAKAKAEGGARKPPARKMSHKAGAGMAQTRKTDTKSRAKQASRARQASKSRGASRKK